MKKITLSLTALIFAAAGFAQDVTLTDSVIYIDHKPIALYYKELNKSIPRYNMKVYSLTNENLVNAEVIQFNAPVDELKPFFYYELSFPSIADTFAVYVEDEAFPLLLAKLIRDYKLIENNQLNKENVARFKTSFEGGPALTAKIKTVQDYLDETRHFSEQAKRDRSKPVSIINDRIIMQDGIKIGNIAEIESYKVSSQPVYANSVNSGGNKADASTVALTDHATSISTETQYFFSNGRKVEIKIQSTNWSKSNMKEETGRSLYEISKPKKLAPNTYTDRLLKTVCFLIEDYRL